MPLFHGILKDLFPGIVLPAPDYVALDAAMANQAKLQNIQMTEFFRRKTIQLYEMICVRHGLMIVGRPFGSKSSMLKILSASLTECKKEGKTGAKMEVTEMYIVNPKSILMSQVL